MGVSYTRRKSGVSRGELDAKSARNRKKELIQLGMPRLSFGLFGGSISHDVGHPGT